MSSKTRRRQKPTLREVNSDLFAEQTSGPNFYGDPSFSGTGNFGRGGFKQLAGGLSGPTKDLQDQEQSEINQNIDDQSWNLGKYQLGGEKMGDPVPSIDGRNGQVESVAEEVVVEQAPYDNATSRMRDLPGFPAPNTLVEPRNFVPANAPPDEENPVTGEKARYLGPTLDGIPLEINDDQTDKELDALLGQEAPPEDTGREPPEEESRDLILHDFLDEVLTELLGAPKATYPNRQGWNNKQINALAWRKNQLNPQEPPPEMWRHLFKEPKGTNPGVDDNPYTLKGEPSPAQKSPVGTFGAIGFPKQFVPQDYETANPDYASFAQDPLGTRRLTSPPSATDPRLGTNPSISEAIKVLVQEALEELISK